MSPDNPIDSTRYQVPKRYAGRVRLANSGGKSLGEGNLTAVVRAAILNHRAGGQELTVGHKNS